MLRGDGGSPPLLRALGAVLLVDASATSVVVETARGARGRPSAAAWSGVAAAAVASLLPGVAAVLREVRGHGSETAAPHRMRPAVLLLLAGMLIATAGALLVLPSTASVGARGSAARRADLLLLLGGNLIGVPYLVIVSALHRGDRAERSRPSSAPRPTSSRWG